MRDDNIIRCPGCGGWITVRRLDTIGCPACARRDRH